MPSPIVDAVTAVLVYEGEILLARRQPHLAAFPGYWAFPGGKVDRSDGDDPLPGTQFAAFPARLIRALVREIWEELGYDLVAAAELGDIAEIRALGVATSPAFVPARFNTHFFRIELRARPTLTHDANEIEQLHWRTPQLWLETYGHGELLLAPPTLATLRASQIAESVTPDFDFAELNDPARIPMMESVRGVRQLFVRSNTLPPADRTNCFLLGDDGEYRVLVDPSPCDANECERLCQQAGALGFNEVFLTHHHHDHRQYANEIARRFGVPIGLSADTHTRIRASDPRYFDGIEVRLHHDGDVVTRWLGQPLRVHAVPGHDEGQLALMPDSRAFCVVGDLIQGIGTVVIAPPEGDMSKYFATLERVIALNPRVILPSHGGALGGVFYLQQALKHRREREAQIVKLLAAGHAVNELLSAIYQNLDPRLIPLARMNITRHLTKLRSEGAIAG